MDERTKAIDSAVRSHQGASWAAATTAYDAGVAAERERCAKLCEELREAASHSARDGHRKAGAMNMAASCAAMIRALGVTPNVVTIDPVQQPRGERMRRAGYTRRTSAKSLPSDE